MRKTRKFLMVAVILLASVLLFGCDPIDGKTGEKEGLYTYRIEDGGAVLVDVDDAISGNVVLPETLGGCRVIGDNDVAGFRHHHPHILFQFFGSKVDGVVGLQLVDFQHRLSSIYDFLLSYHRKTGIAIDFLGIFIEILVEMGCF